MPRGVRAPAISRERPCPKCGADEWRTTPSTRWQCIPCDRRRARAWQRSQRANEPIKVMWLRARRRAREQGTPFTITVDDVKAVWPADGRCPILGLRLTVQTKGAAAKESPSLDRINPAWGYEPGNIAVISHAANRAKGDCTAEQLEKIAQWMRGRGLN